MKYILWPPIAILLILLILLAGTIKLIFIPIWHFRLPTIREAFTFEDDYFFEKWSWKRFFHDILIYKPYREEEDEE